MIENVKLLLGEAAANYTNEQIGLAIEMAKAEVEAYCGRTLDKELEMIAQRIATIKLTRTEGLQSQSYSGVSESYVNGYPNDIMLVLNRKRKVKLL